jgi:hypothetical protein
MIEFESYSTLAKFKEILISHNAELAVDYTFQNERGIPDQVFRKLIDKLAVDLIKDLKKIFYEYDIEAIREDIVIKDQLEHNASYLLFSIQLKKNSYSFLIRVRLLVFQNRIIVFFPSNELKKIDKKIVALMYFSEKEGWGYYIEMQKLKDI